MRVCGGRVGREARLLFSYLKVAKGRVFVKGRLEAEGKPGCCFGPLLVGERMQGAESGCCPMYVVGGSSGGRGLAAAVCEQMD